jgi:hypothetical protein
MAQFRVWRGSVQGTVWLSSGAAWLSAGCGVAQFRVWRGSVDRVQRGSVRVRCDSVQGAA